MKTQILSFAFAAIAGLSYGQTSSLWTNAGRSASSEVLANKASIANPKLFNLNVEGLKSALKGSPNKLAVNEKSATIITLPSVGGKMEDFKVSENSNFDPALAAKYPEIKSYVGQSLANPANVVYFSLSPLGLSSMEISSDNSAVFIEPYTTDASSYVVYQRSDKKDNLNKFECLTIDDAKSQLGEDLTARPNADDAVLRTFRLALSCTGEYTAYFGGTKAKALAAMNNTMTRVNGVFQKDFSARMIIISNNDSVIYTNASTDPYSNSSSMSQWNGQLQSTLTSVIGESNYDIGHLFGASGGGGNAGCIGCVCVNGSKGKGITSPSDNNPSGDNFDIDYVAHEMGHQFGGNHTFTKSNEGTGVQMEPGSGSTIMGYAGITNVDVQPHSDPYFHAVTIQQITNNIKSKTCPVTTSTGNSIPTANAGADYTIPKSTPFMLTGTSTDANGDALTYIWEQMDNQANADAPSATKTTGVNFRSYMPTTSPTRYFPRMQSVLAGSTTTASPEITVEALSSVGRTLNFRYTVRDNRPGGSGNNSDDAVISVNSSAGPFAVTSQSSSTSYTGGSSQAVTWNVAGTTSNGVNAANVDILWSTDSGNTWSTLLSATPNDGSQNVTIPNTSTSTGRIMVKGTNHVFFNVNKSNISVSAGAGDTVAPKAPVLSASGTTSTSTNLSWSGATDNVGVTGYDIYRGTTLLGSTESTSATITGLSASTTYSFNVKAKDAAGNISVASNAVSVTTPASSTDTTPPTAPSLSVSGTTASSTNLSWSGSTDNVGVIEYDVFQNASLIGSTSSTSYAVSGLSASTSYTFSVKAKDAAGNVSVSSNNVSVTTLSSSVSYCSSSANSTADERIGNVKFNTINNSSTGTSGYENFTSVSTNVTRGTNYSLSITPTWRSTKYSEAYAVYIDYNGNGTFTDAGENVWTKAGSTTSPVTGSITIPSNATLGATRMRVMMKYYSAPSSPCENFSYGQVEDYTINIMSSGKEVAASTANPAKEFSIFPNPVTGKVLNISNADSTAFSIYDMSGKLLQSGEIVDHVVNLINLPKGVYIIQVGSSSKRFIKE
ncbi:T9SS type A sorting domain-containing protein [Chryseobacterium sp. SNU WT5]|uniref:reprolysin-like metallopeptidase n=1 Tax=Chryseobacterium sp. SNU WT5 TaxID=2594269 RepID=UPI0011810243|nr:zinc-dependent metalloprotease family protein [Chryseobacterium sp. SNU WT5]QDP86412.1 T9SS type A sorting domain-containing protein [Chryseobacterium sp. SNU WT5]